MSYPLFLELAKVVGASRMIELCELYLQQQKPMESLPSLDASGGRFWRDCSNAFVPVFPPAWRALAESIPEEDELLPSPPPASRASSEVPPPAPKKEVFQSPFLGSSSPARHLDFDGDLSPLEDRVASAKRDVDAAMFMAFQRAENTPSVETIADARQKIADRLEVYGYDSLGRGLFFTTRLNELEARLSR